jgi:hypothetical protein
MGGFLRQATAAQSRALGPFVDSTDFKTAETALTIANTDIKLIPDGGASSNKNSGGGTHRANGVYGVTFDATDTATVGELEVSVVVAGALPVFDKFTVLEEAVYDALFASGAAGYQVPIWAAAGSTVNLSATTVATVTALSATGLDSVVMSDISAVPGATASIKSAINWLFALHRNKRTQTSTTETLFKDDGSASLATSTKSDDGTTFTRGEYQ